MEPSRARLRLRRHWPARALAAWVLLTCAVAAAPAVAGPGTASVAVASTRVYTDAGLAVRAGETVTVTASGHVHFGGGRIAAMAPAGLPWGAGCTKIAHGQARTAAWPAPGLRCWSLIAKVGTAPPLEVGAGTTFRATTSGELSLGVNDNFVADNAGTWTTTVAVSTATGAPAVPAPAPAKKSSDSTILIVLVGAVVLAGGALLFVARRVRRARRPETEAPRVAAPDRRQLAVVGAPAAARPAAVPAGGVIAPVVPEPRAAPDPVPSANDRRTDPKIFEIEFSNGLTLRVGYKGFPEGCVLEWKVTQSRAVAATGYFVTKGGDEEHFQTIPLGLKLEGRSAVPDGADAQFDWKIDGAPFRYSVRRDPNC